MDQTSVAAVHYAPCYAYYNSIECEDEFWVIDNAEMSSGGWPSIIGDNSPNGTFGDHSFFSDDFVVWEPWVIQGPTANDFFIRSEYEGGLEPATWAGIKTLF